MRKLRSVSLLAVGVSAGVATSVAATPVVGLDVLRTYNLVVMGDLDSSSGVDGRTFVGGNLKGGSSRYQQHAASDNRQRLAGLTVVGDVLGSSKKNLGQSGGANVGGSVSGGFEFGSGSHAVRVGGRLGHTDNLSSHDVSSGLAASNPSFIQDLKQKKSLLQTSMSGLTHDLSQQEANSRLTVKGNRGTFNARPDSQGVAVFNISASDLDKIGEVAFNLNGAKTAIVNVSGQSVRLNDNFLGDAKGLSDKVIWNFPDAKDIALTSQMYGSILAPYANAKTSSPISGAGVFGSMTQKAAMYSGGYAGSYSIPSSYGKPGHGGGKPDHGGGKPGHGGGKPGHGGGKPGGGSSSGGSVPVPEPGVIGILGLGVVAIAVWRRRALRTKA